MLSEREKDTVAICKTMERAETNSIFVCVDSRRGEIGLGVRAVPAAEFPVAVVIVAVLLLEFLLCLGCCRLASDAELSVHALKGSGVDRIDGFSGAIEKIAAGNAQRDVGRAADGLIGGEGGGCDQLEITGGFCEGNVSVRAKRAYSDTGG